MQTEEILIMKVTRYCLCKRFLERYLSAVCITIIIALSSTQPAIAAVDKITSSTKLVLNTASSTMPESALLDVGILKLDAGLELTDEDDTVFPEIRFAEAIYFSNQLAKILEKSGSWGAVRVIPNKDIIVDLTLTGTILQSDGETLDLEIELVDSSGKLWFSQRYKQMVGKYAYDLRLKSLGDPFQNLFVRIANDMLTYREKLTHRQALQLRNLSELRFAKVFSPAAFDSYIREKRDGTLTIERLPAVNDKLMLRVLKIRERDYLYVDSMHDYFDEFSQRMHLPYQDFRRSSYDSVVKARQLKKQGNRRIAAGVGAVLAGIYGRSQATSSVANDASIATAAVGGYAIKSGLEKKQQSAAYNEAVAEMGISLETDIAPQVIKLEDQTVTLTGSVQAQYRQWQALLQKIYVQERGEM
jgi:hypothetical protein